jgi:hypothetical protein
MVANQRYLRCCVDKRKLNEFAFLSSCSLHAVSSAHPASVPHQGLQNWGSMSVDSPATIIPFERFLECRERRRRIAAEAGTVVTPASTGPGIQPEAIPGAHADHWEPPWYLADRLVDL